MCSWAMQLAASACCWLPCRASSRRKCSAHLVKQLLAADGRAHCVQMAHRPVPVGCHRELDGALCGVVHSEGPEELEQQVLVPLPFLAPLFLKAGVKLFPIWVRLVKEP